MKPATHVIRDEVAKRLLARAVSKSLTGRLDDLRGLLFLGGDAFRVEDNPGLAAFMRDLKADIDNNTGMATLFLRVGSALGKTGKRKLVENLIYNWGVLGNQLRRQLATLDSWVPSLVVISPTMRCNLRCTGCYSGLYTKDGELSERDMENILDQCRQLGIYFVVISGGEPYVLKEMLLRLFRKYNDMFFLTYTNGTLLDEPTVRSLAKLGNVAPAISVEGFRAQTDHRRGSGTYEVVTKAMQSLKSHGVLFGMSVTYTRENIDVITGDAFIEHFIDKGVIFAWYFMFMPVGKDPILELVPTPEQRLFCGRRVSELRRKYPIFLADFWNDGPAASGCLAGGRSYLHILNSGRVEPCVFAHFGVDNIRDKSLREAANSPFFKAIRARFPYNDNGNLMRPCMIIDNPQVLRETVAQYIVPEGHAHSEDIIRDPHVVEWVDDYSERFKALTDPLWESQRGDPGNRWYRQKSEYKNLFSFQELRGKGEYDHGQPDAEGRLTEISVRKGDAHE